MFVVYGLIVFLEYLLRPYIAYATLSYKKTGAQFPSSVDCWRSSSPMTALRTSLLLDLGVRQT